MSDEITEKNIEKTIMDAIGVYFDKSRMLDALFWKSVIVILSKKYNFADKFNIELEKQRGEKK